MDTRADRTGSLLLALLVVVATLWACILAYGAGWEWFCGPDSGMCEMGGCESCQPTWPASLAGIAVWAGGALLLLVGLWCAWRVGSGHWGLRRHLAAPGPRSSPGP
jgi:hypothetical protein